MIDLNGVREAGVKAAAKWALARLTASELDGFWVHFDADVLDDAIDAGGGLPACPAGSPGMRPRRRCTRRSILGARPAWT